MPGRIVRRLRDGIETARAEGARSDPQPWPGQRSRQRAADPDGSCRPDLRGHHRPFRRARTWGRWGRARSGTADVAGHAAAARGHCRCDHPSGEPASRRPISLIRALAGRRSAGDEEGAALAGIADALAAQRLRIAALMSTPEGETVEGVEPAERGPLLAEAALPTADQPALELGRAPARDPRRRGCAPGLDHHALHRRGLRALADHHPRADVAAILRVRTGSVRSSAWRVR